MKRVKLIEKDQIMQRVFYFNLQIKQPSDEEETFGFLLKVDSVQGKQQV